MSEAESIVDNIEAVLKAENAGDNRRKRKQLLRDMTDFFIHNFKNVRFDEDGRYAETLGKGWSEKSGLVPEAVSLSLEQISNK